MKNVNELTLEEVVKLAEKMLEIKKYVEGGIEYYDKKAENLIERALSEDEFDDKVLAVKAVMYDGMKRGFEEILGEINRRESEDES